MEAENVLLLRSNDGREQAVELVDALFERGRVGRNRQLLARKLSTGFALDHDTAREGRVGRGNFASWSDCCRSMRQLKGEKQKRNVLKVNHLVRQGSLVLKAERVLSDRVSRQDKVALTRSDLLQQSFVVGVTGMRARANGKGVGSVG